MADKTETTLKKDDLAPGFESLQGFYERFGRPILFGLIVVLAILTLGAVYKNRQAATLSEASELYWTARSPQELTSLPDDYPQSPLAPLARIRAAKEYFDNGQYAQALNLYREFQAQHADHFMLNTARMGEWHSQEALGQTQEALNSFARFAEEHPDHFLAPQAILGHARCLETLDRIDAARDVYELFIASGRHPSWTDLAQDQLERLDRRGTQAAVSVTLPIPPATEDGSLDTDVVPSPLTIPGFSPIQTETP